MSNAAPVGPAPRGGSAQLSGVVLAAGASSRMGRPKQLLTLGGRPLLQHVIDAAADSCLAEIVVVLGHAAGSVQAALDLPRSTRCRVVVAPAHREGQAASLRAGLAAVQPGSRAAAILLGDQPSVSAERIDRVAHAFLAEGRPVARPFDLAPSGERVPGHPVVLARSIWPAVTALSGDEGARALLARHPEWLHALSLDGSPPPDVDREADLEHARRALRDQALARFSLTPDS